VIDVALRQSGIDHLIIDPDKLSIPTVRRFFASRGLLGRVAR
jgi:hypothetical protein